WSTAAFHRAVLEKIQRVATERLRSSEDGIFSDTDLLHEMKSIVLSSSPFPNGFATAMQPILSFPIASAEIDTVEVLSKWLHKFAGVLGYRGAVAILDELEVGRTTADYAILQRIVSQ